MQKLDHPPAKTVFPVVVSNVDSTNPDNRSKTNCRLVVLVPDSDSDYTPVIHRVWELAHTLGSRVQFLGLCKDAVEEPRLRRQLVIMSALAQDGKVPVEVHIEFGTDWVKAIKSNWKDGDMIVCFSEQRVGLSHRPLSQILESNLYAPVYVLSGLLAQGRPGSNWLKQTLAWSSSIGIIFSFFWLQTRIYQISSDWAYTTLFLLSLFFEALLLLFWNSLFG